MNRPESRLDTARAVLGVPSGASRDQVDRAYRRLAKTIHPDVSTAPDAAARFDVVAAAYRLVVGATTDGASGVAAGGTAPAARAPETTGPGSSRIEVRVSRSPGPDAPALTASHEASPMLLGDIRPGGDVPIVAGPVRVRPHPAPGDARRSSPTRGPDPARPDSTAEGRRW